MVAVITAAIYQHLIKTIDSHVFSGRRTQKTFRGDSRRADPPVFNSALPHGDLLVIRRNAELPYQLLPVLGGKKTIPFYYFFIDSNISYCVAFLG